MQEGHLQDWAFEEHTDASWKAMWLIRLFSNSSCVHKHTGCKVSQACFTKRWKRLLSLEKLALEW
jgi:hypothetical protein